MFYNKIKSMLDFCFGVIGLLLCFLPMIVIYLLVILETPGPGIYRQKRYGKNKKIFTIYKFRTMRQGAPSLPTKELHDADKYITRLGSFLRKTALDELPQFINVIKGDMSIVGPRPGSATNEEELANIRQKMGVFAVRPGITGWAQINGRDELAHNELAKAEFDRYYIDHMSLRMDIKCIIGTFLVVFSGKGYREGAKTETNYER